jgi:hypothetical protein
MTYTVAGFVLLFAMLAALAMLVRHERKVKRWLMKSPRRRKRNRTHVPGYPVTMR